ncbi:Fatty-acid-binding protein 1 [Acorus gramineus]|uniref:Chalcone--flavanone isomerase n=1 Tax=Acorus gramineus TaxID=55184 RepID=A0AAV9B5A1_ACOGR|nr:Fatty-acid-binding protein 1 [Acorus gramineus]
MSTTVEKSIVVVETAIPKEVLIEEAKEEESVLREAPKEVKDVVDQAREESSEIEPKTRVSFPIKPYNGLQLNSLGLRKKQVLTIGVKIYAFGIYMDNKAMKDVVTSKMEKVPEKPTKELYELVINSDVLAMVRLVIVFPALTMSMVRKQFDEGIGGSVKKLNGGKTDEELVSKVMGAAKDSIKLSSGSVIEITRLPGYILQTKVKGELVSSVESELLCRAYFNMYLGDEPFDKVAKEGFGKSLINLF